MAELPVKKISPRILESFYTELRRCRVRCDSKPYVEKHITAEPHDCVEKQCKPHGCKGMAASTVRQIHSILSGTLDAAARWEWIDASPAQLARRPKQKPPQPDPPTPAEAARLAEEAFRMDDDWGTLAWLVMTTGMRRGELCGLRFNRVDLDAELIDLRRNWVGGKEKDTKTHQNRRIALDSETVALLREHRERVAERVRSVGGEFTEDLFVLAVRGPSTTSSRTPRTP